MARMVSVIQYVGKAGNTVGAKGKNGVIFKQRPISVANPQTKNQMSTRAALKLAGQVAGMLGEVGRISLQANGFKRTDRGQLVKKLLQYVKINPQTNAASLHYGLHLINNPSYAESISVAITADANSITATFSGAASGEEIAKALLVYNKTKDRWLHASVANTQTAITLGRGSDEAGDELEVYAYGIVLEPKTDYASSLVEDVDGNGAGYIVNVEAIGSDNFDFSPTISAMANVAGDGTVSGGSSTTGGSGSTGGSTSGNFTLNFSATNGSVTATVNGTPVENGASVAAGASVRFAVTPTSGYQLSSVTVNGNSTVASGNSYTLTMPAQNSTVVLNCTANSGGGGNGDVND